MSESHQRDLDTFYMKQALLRSGASQEEWDAYEDFQFVTDPDLNGTNRAYLITNEPQTNTEPGRLRRIYNKLRNLKDKHNER